jgi:hypothetical protein
LAIEPQLPKFACDECGAPTIEIPQWTDDQTVLNCQECGKPVGRIQLILEVLQAALVDDENQPTADEQIAETWPAPRISH